MDIEEIDSSISLGDTMMVRSLLRRMLGDGDDSVVGENDGGDNAIDAEVTSCCGGGSISCGKIW